MRRTEGVPSTEIDFPKGTEVRACWDWNLNIVHDGLDVDRKSRANLKRHDHVMI